MIVLRARGEIEWTTNRLAQQVVEAADRLFYEHGIRAVGMAQIRDASGVSLKRLYQLFPAKDLRRRGGTAPARPRLPRRSCARTSRRCRPPRRGSSVSSTSCTTGSSSPTSGGVRSSTPTARPRPGRTACSRPSRNRSERFAHCSSSSPSKRAGRRTSAISYCCWPTARWSPPRCCTTRPPPSTPDTRPSSSSMRRPRRSEHPGLQLARKSQSTARAGRVSTTSRTSCSSPVKSYASSSMRGRRVEDPRASARLECE